MNILLVQDVIDSLGSHIAVLNAQGVIVASNKAWKAFARANGCDDKLVGVGANYLKVCDTAASFYADSLARRVTEGIQAVLDGTQESFAIDYPCDSPTEQRWFSMTVRPLTSHHKEVLVSHINVTPFKLAEINARNTATRSQREAEVLGCITCSEQLAQGSIEGVAEKITELGSGALQVERASVWMFDATGSFLNNISTFQSSMRRHSIGPALSQELYRGAFESLNTTMCIDAADALNDPRTKVFSENYYVPNRISAVLCATVRSGDLVLGQVCFEHVGATRHWEPDETAFACQLANQMALAITNERRLQAEKALLKSECHFKILFQEHAAIKLLIEPATGRILDANKAAAAFYGWPIEELRTMGIDRINTLPLPEIKQAMAKVKEGSCRTFEFKHRRADGSVRDVEVFGNVIREEGRTIMYSIIHDITDRKWAEAERERLETRNRQLAKEESLRRMAGAIAHLYNNHLQSVVMGLDLLQRCNPTAPEFRECIDAATKAARDASAISTLMLTYLGQSFSMHEPVELW